MSEETNCATISLTREQLAVALNLPQDWSITGMAEDVVRNALMLRVEGAGLPGIPSGIPAFSINPIIRRVPATMLDWEQHCG